MVLKLKMFLEQVLLALNKAKVFYLAGFSLSLGKEVLKSFSRPLSLSFFVSLHQAVDSFVGAAQDKILVVNLSAPFICQKFTNELLRVARSVDLMEPLALQGKLFISPKRLKQNVCKTFEIYLFPGRPT